MGNFRDRLFRRIAAMQNAKAASNKKCKKLILLTSIGMG